MTAEIEIKNTIKNFNENNRNKTFAEFIAEVFKDKYVEIYLGDTYEDISTEQISTSYPAVFCGKVISAFKECLVLDSFYADKINKKLKSGNIVFISERAIKALTQIDGEGIMEDMFLRSKESLLVKKFINPNENSK